MMGRPAIQAILALLFTLAWSHSSEGGSNFAEQIEPSKQSDEIQASSKETSVFRATRDAGRKSNRRRKGNNQSKKKPVKGRKKSGQGKKNTGKNKKNTRKNKKKIGRNRKNRLKLKKKGKKNKKKLRKSNKKITKNKKKSRTKKNRSKDSKKDSREKKKKSGRNKKSKKNNKELRKTRRKLHQEKIKKNKLSKGKPKQACDEVALCQKIKDYIKISNQLRKVRRIVKSCDTMDKKAKKSGAEFEATVTALETAIDSSSGRKCPGKRVYRSRWRRAVEPSDDVKGIKDKLKNCSISAKAKCQKSSVAPCQEDANLTKCETELQGWLTKFGPAKGSCLQASSDCCACITALPDVSKDCLAFDKKSTLAVASKKKCTSGDEQGSFGFCKKLQVEAAEKGPKHAKDNCKNMDCGGPDSVSTKRPIAKCQDVQCTENTICRKHRCGDCDSKKHKCMNKQTTASTATAKCQDFQCTENTICRKQGCGDCDSKKHKCMNKPTTASTATGKECGNEISSDCRQEYDNAKNNGKLDEFYKRCKEEGGANPLKDRCSLCCP